MSAWFNKHWEEPLSGTVLLQHIFMLGKFNAGEYGLVFWTLVQEMRIALLFPLLMIPVLQARWWVALAPVAVASVIGALILEAHGVGIVGSTGYAVTLYFLPLFTLGALLAKHRSRLMAGYAGSSRRLRVALLTLGALLTFYGWIPREIWGSAGLAEALEFWTMTIGVSVLMIAVLASPEAERRLSHRRLVWFGDASYSFYLFHGIILYALVHLLYGVLPLPLIMVLLLPVTVVIAGLSRRYLELPAARYGKQVAGRLERRREAIAPSPSATSPLQGTYGGSIGRNSGEVGLFRPLALDPRR